MKRIICFVLLFLLIFTACSEKVTDSSTPLTAESFIPEAEIPIGEALDGSEMPYQSIITPNYLILRGCDYN